MSDFCTLGRQSVRLFARLTRTQGPAKSGQNSGQQTSKAKLNCQARRSASIPCTGTCEQHVLVSKQQVAKQHHVASTLTGCCAPAFRPAVVARIHTETRTTADPKPAGDTRQVTQPGPRSSSSPKSQHGAQRSAVRLHTCERPHVHAGKVLVHTCSIRHSERRQSCTGWIIPHSW